MNKKKLKEYEDLELESLGGTLLYTRPVMLTNICCKAIDTIGCKLNGSDYMIRPYHVNE